MRAISSTREGAARIDFTVFCIIISPRYSNDKVTAVSMREATDELHVSPTGMSTTENGQWRSTIVRTCHKCEQHKGIVHKLNSYNRGINCALWPFEKKQRRYTKKCEDA